MKDAPFSIAESEVPSPVLIEIPHAGTWIEAEAARWSAVRARSVAFDADLYVNELFADGPRLGATLLCARVSRYVVDLNVAPQPLEREVLGVPRRVVRESSSGDRWTEDLPPNDELERRRALFFDTYHAVIEEQLERKRERFGFALLLCAHSYGGPKSPPGADVVIGTRGHTAAARRWSACIDAVARTRGLSVAHDDPFVGGYSVGRYGAPSEGCHALQLELRRETYMNVGTLARSDGFEAARAFAAASVDSLVRAARELGAPSGG